jgi:hypothetical protein
MESVKSPKVMLMKPHTDFIIGMVKNRWQRENRSEHLPGVDERKMHSFGQVIIKKGEKLT